jgi:hypothetical protein
MIVVFSWRRQDPRSRRGEGGQQGRGDAGRRLGGGHLADTPTAAACKTVMLRPVRLRYANGEISREEYFPGKVELEG